jgi:mRNA turnover protein 4
MGKRSKRQKVVALTKTKKDTKGLKERLMEKAKKCLDTYSHCFVFSHENMTTVPFRALQQEWKDSK